MKKLYACMILSLCYQSCFGMLTEQASLKKRDIEKFAQSLLTTLSEKEQLDASQVKKDGRSCIKVVLGAAVNNGNTRVLTELLPYVSLKTRFGWGQTVVHLSVMNNDMNMTELLLAQGADIDEKNSESNTPLMIATENGWVDMMQLLISKGANVNKQDWEECTPLVLATYNNDEKSVSLLLQHNADVSIKDEDGLTPLHWAAMKASKEIIELLLQNGADKLIQDKKLNTPYHRATYWKRNKEILSLLQ